MTTTPKRKADRQGRGENAQRAKTGKAARSDAKRLTALEAWVKITSGTIGSINRSVGTLSGGIDTLNGSLKANIAGGVAVSRILTRYLVVLRDILIEKGVVTHAEAVTLFEIADLESMLNDPSDPTKPQDGASGKSR
jgi:hypothetical protein